MSCMRKGKTRKEVTNQSEVRKLIQKHENGIDLNQLT